MEFEYCNRIAPKSNPLASVCNSVSAFARQSVGQVYKWTHSSILKIVFLSFTPNIKVVFTFNKFVKGRAIMTYRGINLRKYPVNPANNNSTSVCKKRHLQFLVTCNIKYYSEISYTSFGINGWYDEITILSRTRSLKAHL